MRVRLVCIRIGSRLLFLLVVCLSVVACSSDSKTPGLSVGDGGIEGDGATALDGGAELAGGDVASGDAADLAADNAGETIADAVSDAADIVENPVPACENMPALWVDGVCEAYCARLQEFNLNDLFAPPAECEDFCHEVLDEHPDWLANFLCVTAMEQHYFFGNCWWPKPLPAIDGCAGWCDELVDCGLESALQLPGDKCLCEAACNGIFTMTGEAADPLLECATKTLADTCDLAAMSECYKMPLNCGETCDGLAAQCDVGEDLSALFPAEEDCIDLCQHASQVELFGLQVCISVAGCAKADRCADAPDEPFAGCAEFCDAYNGLCPLAEIPPEYCPWGCTGAAMAIPASDVENAADCIESIGQCPDDDGASFVGCLSGQCTLMCYGVQGECEPGSAYLELYPNGEACEAVCDGYTPFQAQVAAMCHLVAGCDYPELCADPPVVPANGCDSYCAGLLELCPEIPWFSGITCEEFCTGMTMVIANADPESAPDCFDAIGSCPDDWDDAVFTCLSGKCGGVCGHFTECEPDSIYYEQFESENACKEQCSQLDWDDAMAMNWCLSWGACDGADACMSVPDELPDGCDTYCNTVTTICPENGMGAGNSCEHACAGLSMAFDAAQPWDADECLEEYDVCPENPAEIVYGCIIDADSGCVEACQQLGDCDLTVPWVCEVFCTELEADNPLYHTYFTDCVADAVTCDDLLPCVGE